MYGPIDKKDIQKFSIVTGPAASTQYAPLSTDANQTIGVTHHPTGLGKLKVTDDGKEYCVPITDILNEPLSRWRIEKYEKGKKE